MINGICYIIFIIAANLAYRKLRILNVEKYKRNKICNNDVQHENDVENDESDAATKNKQIFNILLLGQTGAGKSTLINSIANYFTYSNFTEAIESKNPICLISTKFKIFLRSTMEEIVIALEGQNKEDQNEQLENTAMSSTYNPRVYEFYGKNIEYHIIDVPGIGDSGGSENDERNKLAILQKLKEFKVLHGIFIVINSTNPRLTPAIKHNYNSLLMELHKNATPNIMFVFTFSKASNYGPGGAMDPLKTYVQELREKGIKIEINKQTVFCIDNAGFKYQCGIKNQRFKDENLKTELENEESWKVSREKIFEMFNVIAKLQAHAVLESTNISEARILIQTLMGPLAKVFTIIEKEMSKAMKEVQINSIMETGTLWEKTSLRKSSKNFCERNEAEQIYSELFDALEVEKTFIWQTIIQLSHFLSKNAIVSVNHDFEDKLKMEIEKEKMAEPNAEVLRKLENRLSMFRNEMNITQYALEQQLSKSIDFDIPTIIDNLCTLKFNGKNFKRIYDSDKADRLAIDEHKNIRYKIRHMPL